MFLPTSSFQENNFSKTKHLITSLLASHQPKAPPPHLHPQHPAAPVIWPTRAASSHGSFHLEQVLHLAPPETAAPPTGHLQCHPPSQPPAKPPGHRWSLKDRGVLKTAPPSQTGTGHTQKGRLPGRVVLDQAGCGLDVQLQGVCICPCQRHREIATLISVLFYIQDTNTHTYFHLASGNLSRSLGACCTHVPLVPWTRPSSQLPVCRAHACAGRRSSRLCPRGGERESTPCPGPPWACISYPACVDHVSGALATARLPQGTVSVARP